MCAAPGPWQRSQFTPKFSHDVLYAFFYLIGLVLYLRYLETERRLWLAAVFGAFVLSMASKPAAAVFPLTLVAIDYFSKRPPPFQQPCSRRCRFWPSRCWVAC